MIKAILPSKKTVEVNDTTTYDNGVKVVPSYLLDPVVVDKDNIEQVLRRRGLLHRGPSCSS